MLTIGPASKLDTLNPLGAANPRDFVQQADNLSEMTYFVADNHTGESVLRRMRPGPVSEESTIGTFNSPAEPEDLVMLGDTLFFTAEHEAGRELWQLLDSSNEPRLVKDINPGEFSSHPFGLHEFNDELYFGAFDPDHGRELWKTDGTTAGTVLVADIFAGPDGSDPLEFFEFNSELYFRALSDVGNELWKTDGTEAGTVLVADINPAGDSIPANFFEFSGELFFVAGDETSGREVWKTDGTTNGTQQLVDILPGPTSSRPFNFFEFNGELLFIAVDEVAGEVVIPRLWTSNGETTGTTRAANEIVRSFDTIEFDGAVLFSGFGAGTFGEPRSYDGENTTIISDIAAGETSSNPRKFFEFKSEVYFTAQTAGQGRELWKTNGTTTGTTLVLDIHEGDGSSSPDHFFEFEDELYFSADDGIHGREVWKTDGTTEGTLLVVDSVEDGVGGIIDPNFHLLGEVGLAFFVDVPDAVGEVWQIPIVPEPTGFPGDANLDERVDFLDFLVVADNFGKSDAVFRDGDFNGNGIVDFPDFLMLSNTFGRSYAVQSVNIKTFGFILDNSIVEHAYRLTGDRVVRHDIGPGLINPPRIVGSIDFDGNISGPSAGRVDENGTYFRGDIAIGSLMDDGRVLVGTDELGTIANGEIVIHNFGSGTYEGDPREVAALVFFEFFFDLF